MTTTTAKKAPATKTTARPATKPAARKAAPAPKPTAGAKAREGAPATKKAPKPEPKTLIEALTTKQAALIKVRANGTRRSLPYLAAGTDERKAAEAVVTRTEKGETVAAIAEDLNVSLATARRFVTGCPARFSASSPPVPAAFGPRRLSSACGFSLLSWSQTSSGSTPARRPRTKSSPSS